MTPADSVPDVPPSFLRGDAAVDDSGKTEGAGVRPRHVGASSLAPAWRGIRSGG